MDFRYMDAFLDGLHDMEVAGWDLAVWVGKEEVYRRMSGWANREIGTHVNRDTIYQLFSMTKPITCTAVMQLYEQGKFLLSDPVGKYLPEFMNMSVKKRLPGGDIYTQPAASPMTIWNLLTMTAGLSYDLDTPELAEFYAANPDYTTRDLVRQLSMRPLEFEPGAYWNYSLCHDVLGALIEEISGLSLGEYFKKNIFGPLEMNNTFFQVPEALADRRAMKFGPDGQGGVVQMPYENFYQRNDRYESGGAGLSGTVEDYGRFARMLCSGGKADSGARILGSGTVDLMKHNHMDAACQQSFTDTGCRIYEWNAIRGYGYGFGLRRIYSKPLSGSIGTMEEFGWSGALGTYLMMDPTYQLSVVFAEQSEPSHEPELHPRIRNLVYRSLED